MYNNVWAKYLPIIRIVLKRSLVSEQILALNAPDFERAGANRKSGYKFMVKFRNGRVDNVIIDLPIASGMSEVLLKDPVVKELFTEHQFNISLDSKYNLTIKHIPQEVPVLTS
jgi:hypothetical protein